MALLYRNPILSGLSGLAQGVAEGEERRIARLYAQQQAEAQSREQALRERGLGLQYQMQEANLVEKQRQATQEDATRAMYEASADIKFGNYAGAKEKLSQVGAQIEDIKDDPDYAGGLLIKFAGNPEYIGHEKSNFAQIVAERADPKLAAQLMNKAVANTYKIGEKKLAAENAQKLQTQKDEAAMARKIYDGEIKLNVAKMKNALSAAKSAKDPVYRQQMDDRVRMLVRQGMNKDEAEDIAWGEVMRKSLSQKDAMSLEAKALDLLIKEGMGADRKEAFSALREARKSWSGLLAGGSPGASKAAPIQITDSKGKARKVIVR